MTVPAELQGRRRGLHQPDGRGEDGYAAIALKDMK
jgi:hypothetical protein